MPKTLIPKYSDRLNFFLVIHNKEVPMKKEFGSLRQKLHSKIVSSAKLNRILLHTLTMAARTDRDLNKFDLPEVENRDLENLRTVFQCFFSVVETVLLDNSVTESHKVNDLLNLLSTTVSIVNDLLGHLDNAWLPKYGSISAEYLRYDTPLDFLETLPIVSKILGKNFQRVADRLKQESLPLRSYYDHLRKSAITHSPVI